MADSFELEIATPERQLLRQEVTEAQIPGKDGFLGILPGHAPLLAGQSALAKKVVRAQERDNRFFALIGDHRQLHLALLDVEDSVCRVALSKYFAVLRIDRERSTFPYLGQEQFGVELRIRLSFRRTLH